MLSTIRHRTITAGLDLARLPADLVTRVLPDGAGGPRVRVQLLVDKVDAAARTIIGGILADEQLQADGTRRRAAADQRVEALHLRDVAEEEREAADRRIAKAKAEADKHRGQAQAEAKAAIEQVAEQADEQKTAVQQKADAAERAVEKQHQAKLEQTEKQAKKARLAAVEERAEALGAEADALTAADEAARLADAAAAAKAERKQVHEAG